MIRTEAWVIHRGNGEPGVQAELTLETITLPEPTADEVLVEPLFGGWEANIEHALRRDPVDVCAQRGDDWMILGNSSVVRVLSAGSEVRGLEEGDICLFLAAGALDECGYAMTVLGFDHPHSIGTLARRIPVPGRTLLRLPDDSGISLLSWGASYQRHFSAWDNWQVAEGSWRTQPQPDDHPLVFGWGGGVVLAELELARRSGFTTAMTASSDDRLKLIADRGSIPIDRRRFPHLSDSDASSAEGKALYKESEKAFLAEIMELSMGKGAAIILDHLGGELYRPALRALGRRGVLATLGWKNGMRLWTPRAAECIRRHTHVFTHAWCFRDSAMIRDLMEETSWFGEADGAEVYAFEDIAMLAEDYRSGRVSGYFPAYQVNPA